MVEFIDQPDRFSAPQRSLLARVLGMIAPPQIAILDQVPDATPIRMVEGGPAARELVMLPSEWDGLDAAAALESERRVRDVRLAQVKADGINALYIPRRIIGGRDGAPLDCALHCQPGLQRLEQAYGEPMVFAGEYVALDGFNATLSEHRRAAGEGVFWLYDAVPHAVWVTGRDYAVPIEQRLERLRAAFHSINAGLFVGMLDFWLLDAGEMRAKAHEVWAAGYEGLVSKRLGSPYVRARSTDWRKIKQRFCRPCEVLDTIHRDGKLRSIIVRGPDSAGSKAITLTGGWSDSEAESIDIGMADGSAGRIVAVEFGLTTGKVRTVRSPKFKGLLA